jgi:hypothetical protein
MMPGVYSLFIDLRLGKTLFKVRYLLYALFPACQEKSRQIRQIEIVGSYINATLTERKLGRFATQQDDKFFEAQNGESTGSKNDDG